MEQPLYNELHKIIKITNSSLLVCALPGQQRYFSGHAIANSSIQFKVVQNRKGHHNPNNLSYVLFHGSSEIMIRVDLNGQEHAGVKTPHIHIYNEDFKNGKLAIPLNEMANYNVTEDIIESLAAFLKYNNFEIKNTLITKPMV